jgi:hypothetical protein
MKILDIRYYETGVNFPDILGKRYHFMADIESLGARIARKLREYGLVLGDYDHLYIVFSNDLAEHEMRIWEKIIDRRIRCIDFGTSAAMINSMTETEQLRFVSDATFSVLKYLVTEGKVKGELVDQVHKDIQRDGTKLEILHRQKDTSSYSVRVTYQIRPSGKKSIGWLSYTDKKSGLSCRKSFIELDYYEDIYYLVSLISVSGGFIRFAPRTSFRAETYNRRYKVPISVSLSELMAA